jgi:carboxypeptidase C (cathepsin A)
MKWDKIYKWREASKKIFKLDEKTVGNYQNYDNLTYATIYKAGHMVPKD